jgi:uncharacterized protein
MEPSVIDNAEQARFEIRADGELAGFVQYRRSGDEIALIHTETDRRFHGRGLAARLVNTVLDNAREQNLAVLPYCTYVRDWIAGHPGYTDLVPESRRGDFGL